MPFRITIREGHTEPLPLKDISSESDLSNVSSIEAYFKKEGETDNHVEGATVAIVDSAARTAEFDPVGAKKGGGKAFDSEGLYLGYLEITWSDGDITEHPNDRDLVVKVIPNLVKNSPMV